MISGFSFQGFVLYSLKTFPRLGKFASVKQCSPSPVVSLQTLGFLLVGSVRSHGSQRSHGSHRSHGSLGSHGSHHGSLRSHGSLSYPRDP